MGGALWLDYQFDEGIAHLKTGLDLSVLSNNVAGISVSKAALTGLYDGQGKLDLAFQMSTEALESATESGEIIALQFAYTSQGISFYYKGYFHEAEKYFLEGVSLYEKTSQMVWGVIAAGFLGMIYGDMNEYGKAEVYHKKCISIVEDAKFLPSFHNVHKLFLAKIKILNHESDIDLYDLNTLIASHGKNRLAVCESFGTRCIAEIYMNIDDQHMAEA